jgi:hypothetical protein
MIKEADLEVAANVGEPWTRLHRRVWDHPGAIVDLGCASWDWSQRFFGKKRVVGVDPFENDPGVAGVEIWKGAIAATPSVLKMKLNGHGSSTRFAATDHTTPVEALSLLDLFQRYNIADVSVLKLNVEGSEIEILMTMPERLFECVDQIAVSFHDFLHGDHRKTEAVLGYLRNWYDTVSIDPRYSWYLGVRR